MTKGYYYFCDYYGGWFVCFARNIREAKRTGNMEFGSSSMKQVRKATSEEVEEYCRLKKIDNMWSWERIMGRTPEQSKEANRRFQMKGFII